MSKAAHLARLAVNPAKLKTILSFAFKGYLAETGWFNARSLKMPVNAQGEPIPWMTYGFVDFITPRLNKNMQVFEYGSGNSTLFWAKHTAAVTAVENNQAYFNNLREKLPSNATLFFAPVQPNGEYARKALQSPGTYHIIVVDGRDRVNCITWAMEALTADGVIILDDSERDFYMQGINALTSAGFRQLSFSGISPGLFYNKQTSVFYRGQNCLNI